MKKRIFSLFFVSALAMGLLSCAYLQTQQRQLAEKLVRLHVVANSDSPSDQAIKLRVRDAVLAAAEPVLGSADDPEQALAAELPALECAAAEMLRALGREESVSVTLQNERFPTRDYETFSLPAGVYRTLRVMISPKSDRPAPHAPGFISQRPSCCSSRARCVWPKSASCAPTRRASNASRVSPDFTPNRCPCVRKMRTPSSEIVRLGGTFVK